MTCILYIYCINCVHSEDTPNQTLQYRNCSLYVTCNSNHKQKTVTTVNNGRKMTWDVDLDRNYHCWGPRWSLVSKCQKRHIGGFLVNGHIIIIPATSPEARTENIKLFSLLVRILKLASTISIGEKKFYQWSWSNFCKRTWRVSQSPDRSST